MGADAFWVACVLAYDKEDEGKDATVVSGKLLLSRRCIIEK